MKKVLLIFNEGTRDEKLVLSSLTNIEKEIWKLGLNVKIYDLNVSKYSVSISIKEKADVEQKTEEVLEDESEEKSDSLEKESFEIPD
jgi:hypothetical protein